MKKQTIHHAIMGLLTLFAGYLYTLANASIITPKILIKELPKLNQQHEEKEAFKYLNHLRVEAGLTPLYLNKTLEKASKNHAHYLMINHRIGHQEEPAHVGYTGKFASHRNIKLGYLTPLLIENVSSNNHSYRASVDGLMAAIYHRFAFLDFRTNEIGIGVAQDYQHLEKTAYVYNLGNSYIHQLCKEAIINPNRGVTQNICANQHLQVSNKAFHHALNYNHQKNKSIVLYPFHQQTQVTPVFYEELPDPLPHHSVSGFPISISFSEMAFKTIHVQSFKLFNQKKEEITESIFFTKENDPNKMLKKFEFVLFPLKRLAWNQQYHVEVIYKENGIIKKKQWTFRTQSFNEPFHKVQEEKTYHIKKGMAEVFYFPPLSAKDVLGNLRYPSHLDITFIDQNTIKLIANQISDEPITLQLGKHRLNLIIKP
jgi:uncharacterized protein YkwD